jgi:hypothetical protein
LALQFNNNIFDRMNKMDRIRKRRTVRFHPVNPVHPVKTPFLVASARAANYAVNNSDPHSEHPRSAADIQISKNKTADSDYPT